MRIPGLLAVLAVGVSSLKAADGGATPADMAKPVRVFILMGQSNMVGMGKVSSQGKGKHGGPEGSLEAAAQEKKQYTYLVDGAGNWIARQDVRYVFMDDVSLAKRVLSDLDQYCPGAKGYEVAGFFFWQGEKDCGNAVHAARYEQNLVRFIKQLRKDFHAPDAKFVLATLGEATKGCGGNGGKVLQGHLAVDGKSGKYPEFKGNVATVYSNPMARGGSGNGHYGGNAEVYMDVGEAMGKAMVELLKNKQ